MDITPEGPSWFRLDNAAKIFPSIIDPVDTQVFRLNAIMKRDILIPELQQAFHETLKRYPSFHVTLKKGIFWFYLEKSSYLPAVHQEEEPPCRMFTKKSDGPLYVRVLVYRRRISFEVAHILTDGTGALEFLKTMVARYIALTHNGALRKDSSIRQTDTAPSKEEYQDSYLKHFTRRVPTPDIPSRAYRVKSPQEPKYRYRIITGRVPADALIAIAHEKSVTVTELLTAMNIDALYQTLLELPWSQRKKQMRPIRINVPVNLRRMFPSQTVRNFFLAVLPGIDPRLGHFTLDDIIKQVYHHFRVEIDDRFIYRQISRNVWGEKNPLVRIIPLFIKDPLQKLLYKILGTSGSSGTLSNLGIVKLPHDIADEIETIEFIPNPNSITGTNMGCISFGNDVNITFGSTMENRSVEKYFFRSLRKMGIPVRIFSNEGDK